MFTGIFRGISGLLRAFGAIPKYGLWRYLFASVGLAMAVFYFCFRLIWRRSGYIGDLIMSKYPWERGRAVIDFASDWIVWMVGVILFALAFKHIMLVLSAPLMSMVSEKIEKIKTGATAPSFSFKDMVASLARGLRISVRNLWRELLFTGLILGLGLIIGAIFPPLAVVTGVLIFLVQAYYAGFGNLDFYMERHFNLKETKNFVRKNRGLAIANGSAFLGLLMIPVLGWFLGPFITAIGATLGAIESGGD